MVRKLKWMRTILSLSKLQLSLFVHQVATNSEWCPNQIAQFTICRDLRPCEACILHVSWDSKKLWLSPYSVSRLIFAFVCKRASRLTRIRLTTSFHEIPTPFDLCERTNRRLVFAWLGSFSLKTDLSCQQCHTKLNLPLLQKIVQLKSTGL